MAARSAKTARFTEVVKTAGKPEPYTFWVDPKKDTTFQAALKAGRVMSVHQETVGTKADYGEVGYKGDPQAQILIFPKSIKRFAEKRVIGLKYDQLEAPEPAPARATPKKTKPKLKPTPPAPKEAQAEVEPRPASRPPKKERPKPQAKAKKAPDPEKLIAGIKAALELLDDGKVVAAYRTLKDLV